MENMNIADGLLGGALLIIAAIANSLRGTVGLSIEWINEKLRTAIQKEQIKRNTKFPINESE